MAEPHDPSPTDGAVPTAAELFDPASFAVRLAEARERRSRVLAGREPRDGPSAEPDAAGPLPLHRLHRGFALGLCLGLAVAVAVVPAASLLRLAAAPAPVAGVAVRMPALPASTAVPPLPAAGLAAMASPTAPPQFLSVAVAPPPAAARLVAHLEPVARPQPRPVGLRRPDPRAQMSARNRPAAPSPAGLLTAILGGLDVTAARLIDAEIARSIGIEEIPARLLKTPRKMSRKAAPSSKRKAAAKASKSRASKSRGSKGRKASRKH